MSFTKSIKYKYESGGTTVEADLKPLTVREALQITKDLSATEDLETLSATMRAAVSEHLLADSLKVKSSDGEEVPGDDFFGYAYFVPVVREMLGCLLKGASVSDPKQPAAPSAG